MQIADIAGAFLKKEDRKKTKNKTMLRKEGNSTGFALAKDFLFMTNQELNLSGF